MAQSNFSKLSERTKQHLRHAGLAASDITLNANRVDPESRWGNGAAKLGLGMALAGLAAMGLSAKYGTLMISASLAGPMAMGIMALTLGALIPFAFAWRVKRDSRMHNASVIDKYRNAVSNGNPPESNASRIFWAIAGSLFASLIIATVLFGWPLAMAGGIALAFLSIQFPVLSFATAATAVTLLGLHLLHAKPEPYINGMRNPDTQQIKAVRLPEPWVPIKPRTGSPRRMARAHAM